MKKSIQNLITLCILCLMTSTTYAQNAVGGKIGVNLAKWAGEDFESYYGDTGIKSTLGMQMGLAYQIAINETVSIQPELLFIQKGMRIEADYGGGYEFKQIIRFNYLEVPVLIKVNFPLTEGLGAFVNAGPSVGYALSGVFIFDDGQDRERDEIDFDDADGFNRTDISLNFGGGVNYNISSGIIFAEARYLFGISNMSEDDDFEVKNRGIGVTAGFMLPIGE